MELPQHKPGRILTWSAPRTNEVGDATYRPTWREAVNRMNEQENRTRSKVPRAYGEMSVAYDVTRNGLRVANA